MHSIHADILPLNRERTPVADIVECYNDVFELDVTVSDGSKIPVASVVAKVGVTAKDTHIPIAVSPPRILHMCMVDAIAELTNEFHVIDSLVTEMRGIVVKAKAFVSLDGIDRALR